MDPERLEEALASTERVALSTEKTRRTELAPAELVVTDTNGKPVEGAFVRWIEAHSYRPAAHVESLAARPWKEWDNELYQTDASGSVRLPRDSARGIVLVTGPQGCTSKASGALSRDRGSIVLASARTVLVRVLDSTGVPLAGVPVASWSRGTASSKRTMSGTTRGSVGLERLLVPDSLGTSSKRKGKPTSPSSAWVGTEIPLANQILVCAENWTEAHGAIDLRLPPTAPLEIALSAVENDATRDRARVSLLAIDGDVATTLASCEGNAHRALQKLGEKAWTLPAPDGVARFPFVGLRTELLAFVEAGKSREVSMSRLQGPEEAGVALRRTIEPGPLRPTLCGRLIDPDGVALAKARVGLEHLDARGPKTKRHAKHRRTQRGHTLVTGEDGRFEIVADRSWAGKRLELGLGRANDGGRAKALVFVPDELSGSTIELGDVPLVLPPILAAGIVRDASGTPIEGARVSLRDGSAQHTPGAQPGGAPRGKCQSDREGRFEVRGEVGSSVVQLRCELNEYWSPPPIEVLSGREDLEFVLFAAASLSGSFRKDVPDLDRPSPLSIALLPHPLAALVTSGPAMNQSDPWMHQRVHPDETFSFPTLPPGTADLRVMLDGQKTPVLEIPGIVLASGEPSRDPRLQDIELPMDFYRIDVHVETANGGAIAQASARRTDEAKHRVIQARGAGTLSLLATIPAVPLRIWAEGFRELDVVARSGDTFVLAPEFEVRVEVTWDAALAAARARPSVELEQVASGGATKRQRRSPLRIQPLAPDQTDPTGSESEGRQTFTFAVPAAGPYEVHAQFTTSGRPQKIKAARNATGGTIQVYESSAVQSFQVVLAPLAEQSKRAPREKDGPPEGAKAHRGKHR
jgi:protocatechuate 3,4-dioxygenase beta subunit